MTRSQLATARVLAGVGAVLLIVAALAPWWESAQGRMRQGGGLRPVTRDRASGGPTARLSIVGEQARFSRGLVFTRLCRLRQGAWACEWEHMVRALSSNYRRWVGLGRGTAALALWAALLSVAAAVLARRSGPWLRRILIGTFIAAPLTVIGGVLWLGPLRPALVRSADWGAGPWLCVAGAIAVVVAARLLWKGALSTPSGV